MFFLSFKQVCHVFVGFSRSGLDWIHQGFFWVFNRFAGGVCTHVDVLVSILHLYPWLHKFESMYCYSQVFLFSCLMVSSALFFVISEA